jgi:uncharacterized membrane protein
MPGTRAQSKNLIEMVSSYSNAAVTANQYLWEFVSVCYGRINGIKVYAATAGTGGGNTVIDVLRNGVSIWSIAGNKPTLLATSTGEFANSQADAGMRGIRPGDLISIQVASISTTGHARITASVGLEGNA